MFVTAQFVAAVVQDKQKPSNFFSSRLTAMVEVVKIGLFLQ